MAKFFGFSADYLQRLAEGDPYVEEHFTAYFGDLLLSKLRRRLRSAYLIDEIRQETLFRVVRAVRSGANFGHPEKFGAYVSAVCDNVSHELGRHEQRHSPPAEESADPTDDRIDLDLEVASEERRRLVRKTLAELPTRDREVLTLLFLDELPPEQVCQQLRVDREYLRVLVHRAKARFREKAEWVSFASGSD